MAWHFRQPSIASHCVATQKEGHDSLTNKRASGIGVLMPHNLHERQKGITISEYSTTGILGNESTEEGERGTCSMEQVKSRGGREDGKSGERQKARKTERRRRPDRLMCRGTCSITPGEQTMPKPQQIAGSKLRRM